MQKFCFQETKCKSAVRAQKLCWLLNLISGGSGVIFFSSSFFSSFFCLLFFFFLLFFSFFFFFPFFFFFFVFCCPLDVLRFGSGLPSAEVRLQGKQVSDSLGLHTGTSLCAAVTAVEGCQLIVQPPFSLKGFLSSGTPFRSGSSPAMDSMYSLISLPVLETCQRRRCSAWVMGTNPGCRALVGHL